MLGMEEMVHELIYVNIQLPAGFYMSQLVKTRFLPFLPKFRDFLSGGWGSNFCRSFKISTGEPEFVYSPENYCNLEPENRPGPKRKLYGRFQK